MREGYKVFDHWPTSGPLYLGDNNFKRERGGDLGADSNAGWFWYESTGNGFDGDCAAVVTQLPRGAVIGLKHSLNQRNKTFSWNGKVYDPADPRIAPPKGFARKRGGDLGAPAGHGFVWYEKISDPPTLYMIR